MKRFIAIIAGGVGSRFWPASRLTKPKQFLDILGVGKSLLQLTYDRALRLVPPEQIIVISNVHYKTLIIQQLPELKDSQILLEPCMNNTAPSVLYAALHIRSLDAQGVFAILPSDHIILHEHEFVAKINVGYDYAASNQAIVTLGIKPTRPDTGYGYINYQSLGNVVHKVIEFKEKPDQKTAKDYISSGKYLWNAGIFIWSVDTLIKAYEKHAPQIFNILSTNDDVYGTVKEQVFINKYYPDTPNISVDFAILEPSTNVYTIPADIGWSDIGTWDSLYNHLDKDDEYNVVQCARSRLSDTYGCLIRSHSKDKLMVIKGLEDFMVIDDEDVLLIYPRKNEQEIKQISQSLDYPGIK